jgi:hypothetical protein
MVRVAENRNHILLSHLRLPQLGGPGSHMYIPQEQSGAVILPGTGLPGTNSVARPASQKSR